MNEIIKVTTNDNDEQLVSARDLYRFLEITERYSSWFERMLKYGFKENVDYIGCKTFNALARQELQDHSLKIDMAKEISMIQRTERGKQARQYFLEIDRAWNNPEMVVQRAMQIQNRKVEQLKLENDAMKPKALFADAVAGSENSILIGELAKILNQNGIKIGQNKLFQWMRRNNYLIKREGESYNLPTQKAMEKKLFEIKRSLITHRNGKNGISRTTVVTAKGQQYFINKFLRGSGEKNK